MFIRKSRTTINGKTYTNHLLVESVRTPAGPRQRTICSLGPLSGMSALDWLKLAARIEDSLVGHNDLFRTVSDPDIQRIIESVRGRMEKAAATKQGASRPAAGFAQVDANRNEIEQPREADPSMDIKLPSRGRPAIRLALLYLQEYLRDPALGSGNRIAPARQLAANAGVSYMSMCGALRELKMAGVLAPIGRRLYSVAGNSRNAAGPSNASQLTGQAVAHKPRNRLAQRIADDILKGLYRHGKPLPSLVELQGRYHIGYRPLKKALALLVSESVLEQHSGTGYVVPALAAKSFRARIVCFVESVDSYALSFGQAGAQVFRAFAALCAQAEIAIDYQIAFLDKGMQRSRFRHKESGRLYEREEIGRLSDASLLGYAYFANFELHPFDSGFKESVLASCLRSKCPVCLFDESGWLKLPHALTSSRMLRIIDPLVSTDAGKHVGRRLCALGHRRIAFISTYPSFRWSMQRLEGLKAAFEDAGHSGAVIPFVSTETPWLEDGVKLSNMPVLQKSYARWREKVPSLCRGEFDRAFENVRFAASIDAAMHCALQPLLEQALADPGITAWVLVNDYLTALALPFLRENHIRVPADLSVVSFDDSERAQENDFSSYNFNHQAIATAMLGFILRRKPYCDTDANVPGFIMDRGTVGKARKSV